LLQFCEPLAALEQLSSLLVVNNHHLGCVAN
jgi:hypothetical protein